MLSKKTVMSSFLIAICGIKPKSILYADCIKTGFRKQPSWFTLKGWYLPGRHYEYNF